MKTPQKLRAGDVLTESIWNELIDFVIGLLFPRVAPPLLVKDGVICYAGGFKVSRAVALGTIPGCQGDQMGKGRARLRVSDRDGKLADAQGFNEVDVFNDNEGDIPDASKLKVYFDCGVWNIFNANVCGAD